MEKILNYIGIFTKYSVIIFIAFLLGYNYGIKHMQDVFKKDGIEFEASSGSHSIFSTAKKIVEIEKKDDRHLIHLYDEREF